MEFKATVIQSLGMQGGTSKAGKPWSKAELLVENRENAQYPKKIKLSNMKDADKFAALPVGSEWLFHVEVESREFNGRWYTDVNCWKWDAVAQMPSQPYGQPIQGGYPPQGAGTFYGQQAQMPVNPQSATPVCDSLGVTGYQPQQGMGAPPTENDDLPF